MPLILTSTTGRLLLVGCCFAAFGCSSTPTSDEGATPGSSLLDADLPAQQTATLETMPPETEARDVALLAGLLLPPDQVGVPDSWAIRDLDADVPAEQLGAADADLAFGVLSCPLGPPGATADSAWLRRRYATPGDPLDNGLLATEIVAEVQSDSSFADRVESIDSCVSDEFVASTATRSEGTTAGGTPVTRVTFSITAAPSAEVAFPSQHSVTVSHAGERTVTVALSGIDQGQNWDGDAILLADRVIDLVS